MSDPKMTYDLKKGSFDIGIGGLNYADSLFFRDLDLPYLKLTQEDVESWAMHRKMHMPVLMSSYPSSKAWSYYDYGKLPDFSSIDYRWPSFIDYQRQKMSYYYHQNDMRPVVGSLRSNLIDAWDQDHAFVIGQGARAGLYQSIMMKPANVRYVYPLTRAKTEIQLPQAMQEFSTIVVFNAEAERRDDVMQSAKQ